MSSTTDDQLIQSVLDEHQKYSDRPQCARCYHPWPCPAVEVANRCKTYRSKLTTTLQLLKQNRELLDQIRNLQEDIWRQS